MDMEQMRAALIARRESDGLSESAGFSSKVTYKFDFAATFKRIAKERFGIDLDGPAQHVTFSIREVGGNPK